MAKRGKSAPVRWGIISTAGIGVNKTIPGMMKSKDIEVRAIASRSLAAAKRAAKKLGIPVAYGSYEELLDDPEIEAVYIPLPNHLHVPMTLAAAAKGKHVLCEKSIALTAAEAEKLRSASPDIFIAEAFMVRQHPQWQKARELAQKGRLGTARRDPGAVQLQQPRSQQYPQHERHRRRRPSRHRLLSDPCRALHLRRGAAPRRRAIDRDPKFGIDRTTSALVDFGEGRHLTFTSSTQATPYQRVHILGTKARVEIEIPFNAPQGAALKIFLDDGKELADRSAKTIKLDKADQYQLQGETFSRIVRGKEKLRYGVEDAIKQMRVIDAVFRSEKSGDWETV